MQNQKNMKELDLLKKTSKLPQKQPTKEKSPDTQRTNSSLRAMKTNGYVEGYAEQASGRNGQTLI